MVVHRRPGKTGSWRKMQEMVKHKHVREDELDKARGCVHGGDGHQAIRFGMKGWASAAVIGHCGRSWPGSNVAWVPGIW